MHIVVYIYLDGVANKWRNFTVHTFVDPRKIHKMKNLFRTYYGPYAILREENICFGTVLHA